jgi:hypothetical protein
MHSDFRLQGAVVSLICQPVHRLCVAAALLGTSVLLSTQDVSAVTALKKAPANYQFVPLQTFTVSGSVAEIAAVTLNEKRYHTPIPRRKKLVLSIFPIRQFLNSWVP